MGFLADLLAAIFSAVVKLFQKTPQEVQKEADEKKIDAVLASVSDGSPGFIVSSNADKDQWGDPPASSPTRVESTGDKNIKR
jgi:hypothetical protein